MIFIAEGQDSKKVYMSAKNESDLFRWLQKKYPNRFTTKNREYYYYPEPLKITKKATTPAS